VARAYVIGLTGGIASGKSAVAQLLRDRGAAVVDADALARQVVEPGQPALAELAARFGSAILDESGHLDRKKLGALVFADATARADLNRITHPRIAAAGQAEIARLTDAGAPVVFYEAALLVENRAHEWLDGLIVVSSPRETQLPRLMKRDGIDLAAAEARLAAQLPLAEKLAVATWVVDNSGDLAQLQAEVDRLWQRVEEKYGAVAMRGGGSSNGERHRPRRGTDDPDGGPPPAERVLITGFPAYTARRMAARILASDPQAKVFLLARDRYVEQAAQFAALLPAGQRERVQTVVGDVCDMDLGLTAAEYRALVAEITTIHHMAGLYGSGVEPAAARRVNVTGTRGIVEMAGESRRLRRLIHWSTVQISGRRKGVVLEDELAAGQSFHNVYEETKYEAELLAAAAMRKLPVTVIRPGIIVGDSRTGEIDKFDGPYYLIVLIATNALQVHLPLPGRGTAPLHLVPIDYVVDAGYRLAMDERAAGKTFHLTDPNPLPARRVYELVAEHARTRPPRGFIPGRLARTLLRTPGIEKLARGPLAFLDSFDHQVFYNQRSTQELLEGTGLRCPSFEKYVAVLVKYVQEVHAARRVTSIEDEVFDPFD
jgi:dephospho-CoA kinase